jgi:hypothetical protein
MGVDGNFRMTIEQANAKRARSRLRENFSCPKLVK